jgi:hypothetical protein
MKAYEVLGIDVSLQKASKILGEPCDSLMNCSLSQKTIDTNSKRRLMQSPNVSRKALSLLGISNNELQDRIEYSSVSRTIKF